MCFGAGYGGIILTTEYNYITAPCTLLGTSSGCHIYMNKIMQCDGINFMDDPVLIKKAE